MARGDRQTRQRLEKAAAEKGIDPKDLQKLDAQDLERIESAKDMDNALAQRLQPSIGNQAVKEMMANKEANEMEAQGQEAGGVEFEEEEEYVEEFIEEGVDLEEGLDAPQMGGGGGGGGAGGEGGGAPGGMPWEQANLFGGDDEDDGDAPRRRKVRPKARRSFNQGVGEENRQEEEEAILPADEVEIIDDRLGAYAAEAETERWGDARYLAVESSLVDTRRLGRRSMEPESLVDRTGPLDPIGRPTSLGRFLADHGENLMARSLARLLGGSLAALAPEPGGHAGAVARLANLTVCAESLEGGGDRTDRALRVALLDDAWPEAISVARELGIEGLRAPVVFDRIRTRRGLPPPPSAKPHLPKPGHLDVAALRACVPFGPAPVFPRFEVAPPPPEVSDDADVASVDAILARFTGGEDPAGLPEDPFLSRAQLMPVLKAVDQLLSSFGRMQVELAAAAGAAYRIRACPVRPVLAEVDRQLRTLARQVVGTARKLQQLEGAPLMKVRNEPDRLVTRLRDSVAQFEELRERSLMRLAGAMDA